jgi:predicted DNA-binding transcriptional regulator AlpA
MDRPETEDGAPAKTGPRVMLNEGQILALVPISATTSWRMEKRGAFPKGTYISPNRKVWFEDEIITWQNEVNGRGRGRRQHPTRSKSTTT